MPVHQGDVIVGRYRVEDFLGRGGMAEVYQVWDLQRAVYLAMKVLREDLAEDKIFLRRFEREALTLEKLQHPHIVRFYGLGREDHQAFFLMDYVDGLALRREIFNATGSFTNGRILEVMNPVCSALHYAHQLGMVHCDLKPGNIMIERQGRVLITDFGIARMTDAATATMAGMGTPAYMAPEQIRGEDPIPQTDIYALGVILFEMLTGGERPFTGEIANTTGSTAEKVRWEHLFLEPPALQSFRPELSAELQTFVAECLDKDPLNRPISVLDFYRKLENHLHVESPHKEVIVNPDDEVTLLPEEFEAVDMAPLEPELAVHLEEHPQDPAVPEADREQVQPLNAGETLALIPEPELTSPVLEAPLDNPQPASSKDSPTPVGKPGPKRHGFALALAGVGLLLCALSIVYIGLPVLSNLVDSADGQQASQTEISFNSTGNELTSVNEGSDSSIESEPENSTQAEDLVQPASNRGLATPSPDPPDPLTSGEVVGVGRDKGELWIHLDLPDYTVEEFIGLMNDARFECKETFIPQRFRCEGPDQSAGVYLLVLETERDGTLIAEMEVVVGEPRPSGSGGNKQTGGGGSTSGEAPAGSAYP